MYVPLPIYLILSDVGAFVGNACPTSIFELRLRVVQSKEHAKFICPIRHSLCPFKI